MLGKARGRQTRAHRQRAYQEEQRRPEVAGEGRGGTPDVRAVIRIHRRATAATFGLRPGLREFISRKGGDFGVHKILLQSIEYSIYPYIHEYCLYICKYRYRIYQYRTTLKSKKLYRHRPPRRVHVSDVAIFQPHQGKMRSCSGRSVACTSRGCGCAHASHPACRPAMRQRHHVLARRADKRRPRGAVRAPLLCCARAEFLPESECQNRSRSTSQQRPANKLDRSRPAAWAGEQRCGKCGHAADSCSSRPPPR